MRKFLIIAAVLFAVAVVLPACKASVGVRPAQFEVTFLDVTPSEVIVGETVSVTSDVRNVGGSEGVYTVVLTVAGVKVEAMDITLAPGTTQTVTFSLIKNEAGTYKIAVGELSSSFTVKVGGNEPALVAKEAALKYDDGRAEIVVASPGGYLVDFFPPVPFIVKGVRICGTLYGSGWEEDVFDVEIWDRDRNVLHSATYPVTKFPAGHHMWIDFVIPDIEIADKFYVHVYRGDHIVANGLCIGADDSVVNKHSDVTVRTAGGVAQISQWPFPPTMWIGDKSKVNWMIRVVGIAMVPQE